MSAGGHGHGHADHADHGGNKRVALLIAVLALILAFAETLGKGAQTGALAYNIEASNLWAFFQAKTIRQTVLRTAAEEIEQLAARAKDAEKKRDTSMAAYHHYEVASAAVQIAIVLASASIIAEIAALAWAGATLGVIGVVFCVIGFFFPSAVHLF